MHMTENNISSRWVDGQLKFNWNEMKQEMIKF